MAAAPPATKGLMTTRSSFAFAFGLVFALGGLVSACGGSAERRPAAAVARPPNAPSGEPCTAGDLDGCTERCARGHAASCTVLGGIYDAGDGTTRDPELALSLFERACDGND